MSALRTSKNRKLLGLTTLLVLLLTSFPGPASAQDGASASPGASQYDSSPSAQALDVADVPAAVSENVADGAGSVNEAASGSEVSSAAQVSSAASSTDGTVADPTGQGMTALPETGGVPPPAPIAVPCAVVSLLGCGLLVRSSLRRD
jgi:hypothetical protein